MKNQIKLLAAASLIALVPFGQAQAAASPAKQELINRLLAIQAPGIEILSRELVQRPLVPLMQGAGQALQQVPADKREATKSALESEIKKFAEDAVPVVKASATKAAPSVIGTMLDERFTEDELRQIVAWMESPVSKKFGGMQPEMQEAMVKKIMADVGAQLDARFNALKQDMSKTLGQKPAAAPAAPAASGNAKAAPAKK